MKIKCSKCGIMTAVWVYEPTDHEWDSYYCDDCVPRGCDCRLVPIEGPDIEDEYYDGEYVYQMDDSGRILPCVEYEYSLYGFEDSDVL